MTKKYRVYHTSSRMDVYLCNIGLFVPVNDHWGIEKLPKGHIEEFQRNEEGCSSPFVTNLPRTGIGAYAEREVPADVLARYTTMLLTGKIYHE